MSLSGPQRRRRRTRPPLEELVESVLGHAGPHPVSPAARARTRGALGYDTTPLRLVVLGGGTGLSTVVGGNAQNPEWADAPFVGLKQAFPRLQVVVCTTDDGGSTGRLLQTLPMIAIGDLRKSFVALICADRLQRRYRLAPAAVPVVVRLLRRVFTLRLPPGARAVRMLRDPLSIAPAAERAACPAQLARGLRELGAYLVPGGRGPRVDAGGHCLGNLLLTAAVFRAAGGAAVRPPGLRALREGLDAAGRLVGVPPGCLHPVTATPGQLKFRYANGVEVYGQHKSALVRRRCPIARVQTVFSGRPAVSAAVCRALRGADLIVYAPGSLYTSIIPLLQLEPVVRAIRANRRALKILGANFWIQEGETDLSLHQARRDFYVSDLIEAYDRNVPGGARGLFDLALSANLQHMPGSILRNYALEGKRPIHLDRARVEALGIRPVEATLFALEQMAAVPVIHHDPVRFALAVRALAYARRALGWLAPWTETTPRPAPRARPAAVLRGPVLCDYLAGVDCALRGWASLTPAWHARLLDLAWNNRDIRPEHLRQVRGLHIVPPTAWPRSTAWDNVLGFFDPADRRIKLHAHLLDRPAQLRGDLLIALGEALLGRYIERRRWIESDELGLHGVRCYEIRLRPAGLRECLLTPAQLGAYLALARMLPDPRQPLCYRLFLNQREGFLPPGLLFGLMYAWYLNNVYGGILEYDMSLLQWPPRLLTPHQARERRRKQALVAFFRAEVFGHRAGGPAQREW